ncbi:MAG TPA: alcohol dehydrogenase catalytic domain-containing protein, partial [Polyangiaceae bacterium]|nr:alcohol dehydrogenase catalytic domain-containing protein [Polyangiaceae bacterium]
MRAYRLNSPGLDSLSMFELDVPKPGTGQLLVRLRAASLNYRDLMVAQDRYKLSELKFPLIPLSDAAGEVVAVGEGVTEFGVGDRVIGNFFQKWGTGTFDKEKGDSALGGAI